MAHAQSDAVQRDLAFEGAQWIMASGAAQAVAAIGARMASGDDALGALIRDRQDAQSALADLSARLLDLARAGQSDPETTQTRISAEASLASIEAALAARFPDYAEFAIPRPLSIAETRALLGPDETVLLILTGQTGSYVWAVSKNAVVWHRAELGRDDLAAAVKTLRGGLDPTGAARGGVSLRPKTGGDVPPFDRQTAFALYDRLLAPLGSALDMADHLIVVTDGPLTSLPLSLLIRTPPQGRDDRADDLRATDWLIRHHRFSVLPAVSSLKSLRRDAGPVAPLTRFFGVGAPELRGPLGADPRIIARSGGLVRGGTTDPEAIRRLPPLPGTRRELAALARVFGADAAVLTGAAATEAAVRARDLSAIDVLSFATHGLIAGELEGLDEPALVLTPPLVASAADDGLLTASEAATLRLSAQWVILSACNTAAGDGAGAEALSGLARAFFLAGARALMVSHWPVRDDAAARLITDTLRLARADSNLSRAEALRRAMLGLIDDRRDSSLAHPAAWAPFVLVGDAR